MPENESPISLPTPEVACAALHTDDGGNRIPCPGHTHTEQAADPLDDARRLIAEHEQQRMQACAAEIEQVLARYGMRLDVTPAHISLVPKTT